MNGETSQVLTDDLGNTLPHIHTHKEAYHYHPRNLSDRVAKRIVRILASCADLLFKNRYGHRAIVLETIAAVPGMVGGLLQHLKSLRLLSDDRGWIKTLVDEAENERIHLIVYSKIYKPTGFEKFLIFIVQFFFYHFYFLVYLVSPKTAHRIVGYFEEEAIHSYNRFLSLIEDGTIENIEAPEIAKSYWGLSNDARLIDIVKATIKDESIHRDVNHAFAGDITGTKLWSR